MFRRQFVAGSAAAAAAIAAGRSAQAQAQQFSIATGTTGAVAKRLGRQWIGCERESEYREAALERIEMALPLDESAITTMQSPRAAPKVAFRLANPNSKSLLSIMCSPYAFGKDFIALLLVNANSG